MLELRFYVTICLENCLEIKNGLNEQIRDLKTPNYMGFFAVRNGKSQQNMSIPVWKVCVESKNKQRKCPVK